MKKVGFILVWLALGAAAFGVLVLILILRPAGLLGKAVKQKV